VLEVRNGPQVLNFSQLNIGTLKGVQQDLGVRHNMCYHVKKNKVIIPLKKTNKWKSDQSSTSQEVEGNKLNH
jgi:hypothetical protein